MLALCLSAMLCFPASGEMLDDFEGTSLVASWWGADSVAPFVYTLGFADTGHVHSGAASLRIDFNKANDTNSPYSFLAASGLYNLSNFDYLSFWVYNTGQVLNIKVRLEDDAGNPWETDWASIWPMTKTASADWENLMVDLTRGFSATSVNWKAIRNIMLMVSPGDVTNRGTFWLDDVAVTRAPNGAALEPFESDFYGWSGGGAFTNLSLSTAQFQNSGTPTSLGQQSLKITWPAKGENYDNFIYTPNHDPNAPAGRVGMYTNLTLYKNKLIELWVKSTTDNNFPILMKLSGAKGTNDLGVTPQYYTGAGAWQKLMWAFDSYTNIAATLQTVWIFPYPGLADNGGTMYIDNLGLATGSTSVGVGPVLPLAPTGFVSTAGTPDEDGQYALRWSAVAGATNYVLQQDTNVNFTNPVTTSTTGLSVSVSMNPVSGDGTYYYRVRSVVQSSAGTFTAPLSVRVHQFPEADRRRDVITDFDSLGQVMAWWGSDPAEPWVYQQDFQSTEHVHSGERAMKVTFNKANEVRVTEGGQTYTNAYSFFSLSGSFNFLNFDYLSFWVYNTGTPLRIKIRLEQAGDFSKAWETDWAAIFPQMTTGQADWENLCIDLSRAFFGHFNGDIDLTKVGQIMFMIEPGSETATGEFWMDDISLERAAHSAPLDVFESDFYGWASGAPFVITNTTEACFNDGGVYGLGQRSMKISWGAKAKSFSNITYEPAHDTNSAPLGRVGNHPNFGIDGHNTIELRMKSSTDATIPFLLKFDDADVGYQTYTGSGAWQNVRWEFDTVAGKTNVGKLYLIPYPNMADDGGVMYVDDLNLAGGTIPVVPYSPSWLWTTAKSPDSDGSYEFRWEAVPGVAYYDFEVDEDPNFGSPVVVRTNVTRIAIAKNPQTGAGTWYYRVRSVIGANEGTFGAPMRVTVAYQPSAQLAYENLDTFDGVKQVAFWWANDPSAPYAYTLDFGSTQHVHSGVVALKVDYNKNNDVNVYSFMSAAGLFNFRNQDYLSFWVYNDGSPLKFRIRLEDNSGGYFESGWAGIEPQTRTPEADWENLVFDLSRTYDADSIDMSAVSQIIFMVAPEDGTNSGTFWMDDVQLQRAPNSAPIEPFESDLYGWNGSSSFTMELSSEARHNDGTRLGIGQRSLRVEWTNKPMDYSSIQYDPGHDTNAAPLGRIGNYRNFTAGSNTLIEAWFMSPTEFDMPILLKLDNADVGTQHYTGEGAWEKLTWDISGVMGATNVGLLYFLPYPNHAESNGVFYVDDINFAGGTPWQAPVPPTALDAGYPSAEGSFTLTWAPAPNVSGYQVLEADNADFGSARVFYTTGYSMSFTHSPTNEGGTWYYRVRSYEVVNGVTNVSSYSTAVSAYIPRLDGTLGQVENKSYDTMCAEVDNINVPLWHTNTSAYRITVTHPEYFPVTINERGADFDDCDFTDRNIWRLGTNDGSSAEFRQSGYVDGDVYYALDNPTAGLDEVWSAFPAALDSSVMKTQIIVFTAEEISDVNLEPKIGSRLTVTMRAVTGTLDVRLVIGNGSTWTVVSNQVFDAAHLSRQWNTPDFFWSGAVDANRLRLEVVTAAQGGQTTTGARGDYDSVELWKRDERGEFPPTLLYDDGNIIVEAIDIDFWWRAPDGMTVVTPQGTATNVEYFRIVKRVSDSNTVEYSQVFVMYEDGNVRLLPHPPAGVDWTPFGASVILGPTVEGPRPFAGISTVTVHPKDISMDVVYDDGGSCHMDMWVNREKNVVDVSDIRYDTAAHSFARFRSMWVYDGKSDIDRVESAGGVYPVTRHWDLLRGTWWKFFKEVPTYHNTYCPEFNIEVTDPIKAFLVRQAETFDAGSNCTVVLRTAGRGGEAVTTGVEGGELAYDVYLDRGRPNTHMIIRYADDDGGNNGDYPGNLVQVRVDGVLKGQVNGMSSDGWNDFDMLPSIELGDLMPGWHTIRITVGGGTFGMDLDEFQLISQPEALQAPTSVLVRQAELYDSATDVEVVNRPNTVGGQSIHMNVNNAEASYRITLGAAVTSAYMRVRYADDVGPTMLKVFVDGEPKARFPSLDTGWWDNFTNAWELYMGDLTPGVHTVKLTCSAETWGIDVDEFELYTKGVQNRAPQFNLPTQFTVPIQTTTNLGIYAYDGDGDEVSVSAVSIPANSGFNGRYLAVTTTVADVGTTNPASFTVNDGRGATNSLVSGSTKIVVPADWDGDSLPDTWEWNSFATLALDAEDDPDGDGASNLHEELAGTSPTSSVSVFELAPEPDPVGASCDIAVSTQPGRLYEIWVLDGPLGSGSGWRKFGSSSNGVGTWLETNTVPSHFTFKDYFTPATGGALDSSGGRMYRVKTMSP